MPESPAEIGLARFQATRTFGSLDGLRALSIAAVVWHHTGAKPSPGLAAHGFLGVDLFFVISGFLITTLLLRERQHSGSISLGNFWIRRSLRIFPPYFALLLAMAVALGFVFPNARMRDPFFDELPYLATYTSNWVEMATLFGITWSLATEEQFYLAWPLVERFLARWIAPLLALALAFNQALNFGLLDAWLENSIGVSRSDLPVLQATFTPILLGVVLAHALASAEAHTRIAAALGSRAAAPLAFVLVVALAAWPANLAGLPRLSIHLAMTALVAACVLREDNGLARILELRPIARVGAVSYGVYLYHLIAMHGAAKLWGSVPPPHVARFAATLGLSVVIAELSYRCFEARFLRLKTRFAS